MRFPWQKTTPTPTPPQRLVVHYRPSRATALYCNLIPVPHAGRRTTDVARVTCVPCRAAIRMVVRRG
jgi:hypothetical protein